MNKPTDTGGVVIMSDRKLNTAGYAELNRLRDENERLRGALNPFSHEDLQTALGGNIDGDDSIIYQRNKAFLKLGDFRLAAKLLKDEHQ